MKKTKRNYNRKKTVNKKKKIRKKLSLKFIMILLVACLGGVGIIFSPIFSVKIVEITEMEQYSDEDICNIIGLKTGANIFLYDKKKATEILNENNYIETAEIIAQLPSTIYINIDERKVRGYVPYAGAYLYIDEYGRVLDVQNETKKALPVVYGLKFDQFRLGELLDAKNKESFDVVVLISQMITKYELLNNIMEIDVNDPENITASINQIEIRFGSIENCEQKMAYLAQILSTIPEKDRGVLDLSDMSRPIVFRYLS
ncbi:FtsQ-type POTRA domain-containing protein [Clostridium sp. MD294]|uniref:cell division protein FtsQ/DivIB n=1 Tax=Clostridium sp. MD294 TaxID=97138 RepID=UPI0002CA6F7A|nr:FtsQ-type POTRA domain-containing protein [Clostridium sp. MD294]NDO45878.1 FtsQ-type POTRA domain-containing protein [Clostridium sp. MD294]USF30463.1 Cell division protein DivIB [Clostridium sp. MD294]